MCENCEELKLTRRRGEASGQVTDFGSAAHLKTYSGEKSTKCNQCDFAFSEAGDLRRHLETQSGEKSNRCNQCNFTLSRADHLKVHMKTHSQTNATNVTLHPQRAGYLRKRMITHSGENSNKRNQCDFASSYS